MKTAFFLLTLGALMYISQAECPKNYCSTVTCPKELTKETCEGKFVLNSSHCGCCPTCVIYVGPGGHCENYDVIKPGHVYRCRFAPCIGNRCVWLP